MFPFSFYSISLWQKIVPSCGTTAVAKQWIFHFMVAFTTSKWYCQVNSSLAIEALHSFVNEPIKELFVLSGDMTDGPFIGHNTNAGNALL